MKDERIEKLAELLVRYSVDVQPGQKVMLRSSPEAKPLFLAVYRQVLMAGGLPVTMLNFPEEAELFYAFANEQQLGYLSEPLMLAMETFDVSISIMAETNTRHLSGADPEKMVKASRARRKLFQTFMQRSASGALKWTTTLFPTQAHAQDADMSLTEFEDFVYAACLPDLHDPIGYWRSFSARQQKIVDWLKGRQTVHVVGPDTDLTLSIAGRTFINCDCRANVPDGEIFTGPVENSVNGVVSFSYPAIFNGREVTGVRLWFENGRVVKATATKNEEFLLHVLDTDAGARYVGEFAIGTNEAITRFTREILFDEKIGGSFHMALGAGYPETGSRNESSLHWDMICDLRNGGEIWVDGELLYQNGKFAIE